MPRNGCDGRLMVKILITTIHVNLCFAPNSPELSLLKFLPLTYHHSHFLAATLDFTSFFTTAFLGAVPFFTAWLFLIRYHFFCICIPQLWPALGLFKLILFLYRIKRQSRFLILQLFLILSVIIQIIFIYLLYVYDSLLETCSQLISLLRDLKCS